jgi:sorting nexin-1/2
MMNSAMMNSPHWNNQTFSAVLRRYSDFLWLYDKLHMERAGAIVPPLPEKQPVGRFSPAFVEDRRKALERFLRRVAVHPELADSQCLETFLRADDATFQAAKHAKIPMPGSGGIPGGPGGFPNGGMYQSAMPQQPYAQLMPPPTLPPNGIPPKKEGFKRWFAETKTSISGDLVKSPDDELFEEINRYIHGLDHQMKNVSHQASGLVRKGKEISNGLFEFGLAFNLLGQSEADALGDALSQMGETADRLSVLTADHAEQELQQLENPLVDTIKMIHAVKLALQRRHEKRLTYSTCLQEVESKHANVAKLRAQMGMEAKAYGAETSLRRAQEAAEVARDDFCTVSQRVLREVDRFKREKAEDMRKTVLDYIRLQVEYNKRMEQVWAALIPQLERVQLDHNANVMMAGNESGGGGGSTATTGSPAPPSVGGGPGGRSMPPPISANPSIAPGMGGGPQLHSQPMAVPNPQQAPPQQYHHYQQPHVAPQQQPNPFISGQQALGGLDPMAMSLQYRE